MGTQSTATVQIRKRNGQLVDFDKEKIAAAIWKAWISVRPDNDSALDHSFIDSIANDVIRIEVSGNTQLGPLTVEQVQDAVEVELMRCKLFDVAKAYIKYRHDRELVRLDKRRILNKDELDEVDKSFSTNALQVLASRYLMRNEKGEIVETVKDLFWRVAVHAALPEIMYDTRVFDKEGNVGTTYFVNDYADFLNEGRSIICNGRYTINKYSANALWTLWIRLVHKKQMKLPFSEIVRMLEQGEFPAFTNKITEFYHMMVNKDFMPNSPTLMNAGAPLGQLSACFVLGLEDSLPSIMKAATDSAIIFQSGGGIGVNYTPLRPEGDLVHSTSGVASGPCSFMSIINTVTEVVKQGGKRRGANMAILEYNHPDIEKFVTMKTKPGVMENFNVSVGMWGDFWENYFAGTKFQLQNGRTHVTAQEKDPKAFLSLIANSAWQSAEPGLIFFDTINKYNPVAYKLGNMRCTNPCGEVPLYDYEPCNLGSINLANFVQQSGEFDMSRFEEVLKLVYEFLDNIIDVNKYPLPEIERMSLDLRRIGIGVMGFADMLSKKGIAYNSKEAFDFVNLLGFRISSDVSIFSARRANERGSFDYFDAEEYIRQLPVDAAHIAPGGYWDSVRSTIRENGMRNVFQTTIAPTGSISMIADTSNGIEPHFALAFEKDVAVGTFDYTNPPFEAALSRAGIQYTDELKKKVAENYGSCQGIEGIPEDIQKSFRTTMDIHWMDHIVMQAVWQKWINNAISKTINMPEDATVNDVEQAYLLAHELGCKGITVYRDNSRKTQVLTVNGKRKKTELTPSKDALEYVAKELDRTKSHISYQYPIPTEIVSVEFESALYADCESQAEFARNGCCDNPNIAMQGGCSTCLNCGFSTCHVA